MDNVPICDKSNKVVDILGIRMDVICTETFVGTACVVAERIVSYLL